MRTPGALSSSWSLVSEHRGARIGFITEDAGHGRSGAVYELVKEEE